MSLTRPSRHSGPTEFGGFGCAMAASGGVARVTLSGELDMLAASEFAAALSAAIHDSVLVIVDLSGLTFIDSSGLHVIVAAHAQVRGSGCRLVLIPGPRQVQRLFELTGIEERFEFVADADGLGHRPAARDDAMSVDVPRRI